MASSMITEDELSKIVELNKKHSKIENEFKQVMKEQNQALAQLAKERCETNEVLEKIAKQIEKNDQIVSKIISMQPTFTFTKSATESEDDVANDEQLSSELDAEAVFGFLINDSKSTVKSCEEELNCDINKEKINDFFEPLPSYNEFYEFVKKEHKLTDADFEYKPGGHKNDSMIHDENNTSTIFDHLGKPLPKLDEFYEYIKKTWKITDTDFQFVPTDIED